MAKYIPNFYDFPRSSGGITCEQKFYLLADNDISIRRGTDDAAKEDVRPRIDLTEFISDPDTYQSISLCCDFRNGLKHESTSGVTTVAVTSGTYYGVFTTSFSGIPTSASAYGVIPWEKDFNPDETHFYHDPSNDGENTHVTVLKTGWHEISYTLTAYKSANNTSASAQIRCKINNTVVYPGSTTLAAVLLVTQANTGSWRGLAYLTQGDTISIDCREFATSAGDVVAAGDACSLFIRYIGP